MLEEVEAAVFSVPSPRVAFYLHNFAYGGVQQVFLTLANWFASQGYATRILVMDDHGPLKKRVSAAVAVTALGRGALWRGRLSALRGFKKELHLALAPLVVPLTPPNCLRAVPALAACLQQTSPDVLFSAKPHFNITALLAKRLSQSSCRLVMTQHTSLSQRKIRRRKLRESRLEPLMKLAYQEADSVIGVSSRVSSELVERLQVEPGRVRTIFNPVVPADLQRQIDQGVLHPWLKDKASPVILAAGRMGRVKDYGTLLHALARVRAELPARLLLFSGTSGSRNQAKRRENLLQLSRSLGLESSFRLEQFSGDLLANMARADVFAISSLSEGFGNVVAEALACGCPVVSTNTEGPGEILAGGNFGNLVPVADPHSMAAALLRVLQTARAPQYVQRLRQRASCFSVERGGRKYEQLVHELLGLTAPLPVTDDLAAAV